MSSLMLGNENSRGSGSLRSRGVEVFVARSLGDHRCEVGREVRFCDSALEDVLPWAAGLKNCRNRHGFLSVESHRAEGTSHSLLSAASRHLRFWRKPRSHWSGRRCRPAVPSLSRPFDVHDQGLDTELLPRPLPIAGSTSQVPDHVRRRGHLAGFPAPHHGPPVPMVFDNPGALLAHQRLAERLCR